MPGDSEVARLDFTSNFSEVAAQIITGIKNLQTELDAIGRSGSKARVGQEVTESLAQLAGTAADAGGTIETQVRKILDSLSSLNSLPKASLGANFADILSQLTAVQDEFVKSIDSASRRQLGGADAIKQMLIAPIQTLLDQMLSAKRLIDERIASLTAAGHPEEAARFATLANPGQITRTANAAQARIDQVLGGPLPKYDSNAGAVYGSGVPSQRTASADENLAGTVKERTKAEQRATTAAAAVAQQEEVTVEALRAYNEWITKQIEQGRARPYPGGFLIQDGAGQETFHARPSPQSLVEPGGIPEGLSTAGVDQVRLIEDEIAARKRNAQQDANARQRESEARQRLAQIAQQEAEAEAEAYRINKRLNDEIAANLLRQYQSGAEGISRIGRTSYFNVEGSPSEFGKLTPAGISTELKPGEVQKALDALAVDAQKNAASARRLAQLSDTASEEMRGNIEAAKQKANADRAYATLLQNSPKLDNLEELNAGFRRLSGGYIQLGEVFQKQTAEGVRDLEGSQELYEARVALARTLRTEGAASGTHNAGIGGGSIFDSFLGGAFGHGFDTHQAFDPSMAVKNLASTAGVLARYGYEFKIIQGALDAVKQSFQNLEQYQQVMVELDDVIQSTGAHSLDLSQAFTTASNVAVDANTAYSIGAQALQSYRDELTQGTSANTIFARSTQAVGEAMLLSGQTAQAALQNLIASTNAFQLGSGGQERINDAVVNAVKNFGGNRTDIYNALSTSGTAAQEAGVSPEEMANIVSLIASRTGDNGSTIAQSFDRLVSRQDNQQFRGALGRLGIPETGNLTQEIAAMSLAYNHMTTAEQQAFVAQLGGSRNLKDLLPLLRDGAALVDANARSNKGAGAASDLFAKQLQTLGGQLKILGTLVKDITTNIGRAGLFAGFGAALLLLKPALQGVNELLTVFNGLVGAFPGGSEVVGLIADFYLFTKALDVMRSKFAASSASKLADAEASKVVDAATVQSAESLEQLAKAQADSTAGADSFVAGRDAETASLNENTAALERNIVTMGERDSLSIAGITPVGPGVGAQAPAVVAPVEKSLVGVEDLAVEGSVVRGGLAARAGSLGLAALASPWTYAIAGLIAIGGITNAAHKVSAAADAGAASLNDLNKAKTPDALKNAADSFNQAAAQAKKASSGFFGVLFSGETSDLAKKDKSYARFATREADAIASQQSSDVSGLAASAFGGGATIAEGLQTMKDRGIDATTQLKALGVVLGNVHDKAGAAALALAGVNVGQAPPTGVQANTQNILSLAQGLQGVSVTQKQGYAGGGKAGGGVYNASVKGPDVKGATELFTKMLSQAGYGPTDVIPQAELDKLADAYVKNIVWEGLGGPTDASKKALHDKVLKKLKDLYGGMSAQQIANEKGLLSNDDLNSTLDLLEPQLAAAAQAANPLKLGSQTAALQFNLKSILRKLQNRVGDPNGAAAIRLLHDAQQAEEALIESKVTDLERLRQAAESSATTIARVKAIRKDYFSKEIAAAGHSETALVNIFNEMTKGEIDLVISHQKAAVAAAEASLKDDQALLNVAEKVKDNPLIAESIKKVRIAQAKVADALGVLGNLNTASATAVPQQSLASADSKVQELQQAHIAYLESLAVPGDQLSADQTAINVAKYQLSIATKYKADWYAAQKALADAQHQYAMDQEAQALELAHEQRELSIDLTDPVAVAREAARAARAKYAADRQKQASGQYVSPTQIAQDQVDVVTTTAAAQKAKFDQKMSDEQTAYDLQRISAAQYLRFLERQHDILSAVKHKTRQQIDELNQVDEAMKSVQSSLSGMWNIGDIKVPTPYEVRRAIATKANKDSANYNAKPDAIGGGVASARAAIQQATTNNNNNVTINGADLHQVKALILKLLGPSATQRTSTSTQRV